MSKELKSLLPEVPYLQSDRITLRSLSLSDADGLQELVNSPSVYRYLPTWLYEKKYPDIQYVIQHLYDECLQESLILGVFEDNCFCGLAEVYGCRRMFHKVSVGYRLLERCWGRGIATQTLGLLTGYLSSSTDVRVITASTMIQYEASANVLRKNSFTAVLHSIPEDWGHAKPVLTDRWIRKDHDRLWERYRIHVNS